MTKSDLIDLMATGQNTLSKRDLELAVKAMLQKMSDALASGARIEVLHSRSPRIGRNPKTGAVKQ